MRLPAQLLHRKRESHKGNYGHIFILAGSARFSGAAVLCGFACLRSGAGLITLGIPEGLNTALVKIKPPEIMTLPLAQTKDNSLSLKALHEIECFCKKVDVIAIGPGLSQNRQTQSLVRKVISNIKKPMVIDADGLNALKGHLKVLRNRQYAMAGTVITPHPGEMARLTGTELKEIIKTRKSIAKCFANKYNCVVVLKGNNTVVASSREKIYVNHTGNPGMATAGSGDVLTGIIAAFLGQKLDAFEAAKYAVYLHGSAGDLAAKEKTQISMVASDIIGKIPEAIKKCG